MGSSKFVRMILYLITFDELEIHPEHKGMGSSKFVRMILYLITLMS